MPVGGVGVVGGGTSAFEGVQLRYRPGLPLALKGLSFTARGGARLGVVGRTGAGKSTIGAALFRLVDPLVGGRILIDGVDLRQLALRDVRARRPRGLVIIPQDPVRLVC